MFSSYTATADSETVDTTQQVTSKTPVTGIKNPKRVEAGKRIAEKTRQAREEQKKKLAEAETIIAKEQLRKAEAARGAEPPAAEVETPAAEVETDPHTKNVLTATQWLSVISIIISVVGIYYKREEIKKVFAQKSPPQSPTPPTVDFTRPPVKTPRKGGLQSMD